MFVIGIVAALLLGDLIWWRVCKRALVRFSGAWRFWIGMFTALQAGGLLFVILTRTSNLGLSRAITTPIVTGIYLWHFLFIVPMMLIWLPFFVARCISRGARMIAGFGLKLDVKDTALHSGATMSRRNFMSVAGCAAPAIFTMGTTALALSQLRHFRVRTIDAPVPNLPPALDGLTIAHVTDLHVGQFTHGAILDEIVEATNALRADLVLSTGDLINFALADLPAGLSVMTRLRAEHGVFMCEGNHDLFENAAEFRRRTRAAGIRLLVNESALISIRGVPVQFLGLQWGAGGDDPHGRKNTGDRAIAFSMRELLPQRNPDAFTILLAHHPHAFDDAENIPLTLAGHTHGGQLMLTGELGCGPMFFRYWSGLYRKADRAMVVSNGVGNWFPLRTHAPAEIVHLTLRRAQSV